MSALFIWSIATAAVVVAIVLRLKKHVIPMERRVSEWAKRHGVVVITAERMPDHSLDVGVPGSGSSVFYLVVRDSKGVRREATVRFDVATIGKDSELVRGENA
jgi:hypothetical protein